MRAIGFASVTTFISIQILIVFGAATWAISGLAHLGPAGTWVLAVLLGVPSLYGIVKCVQFALIAETNPAND